MVLEGLSSLGSDTKQQMNKEPLLVHQESCGSQRPPRLPACLALDSPNKSGQHLGKLAAWSWSTEASAAAEQQQMAGGLYGSGLGLH